MAKTILVTGATSGIGYETAKRFADTGYIVIAAGRKLDNAPQNTHRIYVDLLSSESITSFIEEVKGKYSSIDGIIHNAGIIIRKPFNELTAEEIFHEFQTHVFSTIQLNQGLYPLLPNTASLVYINSTLGLKPTKDTSIYSAAKAAQASLVKSLAIEWTPIRVNGICLGIIDTPIQTFTSEQKNIANSLHLLGRTASAREAASEIYHLFHSEWTTGSLQVFDGGILLKS